MSHITADRVMEVSQSTGTGAFTLAGAVAAYRAFSAVLAVADTCHYVIENVSLSDGGSSEWEVGLGTYSSANTLTRTSVLASSNGGSAVDFGAGRKHVWIDVPASRVNALAVAAEYLSKADNLASVASAATARDNLGLGSISTQDVDAVAVTGGTSQWNDGAAATPSVVGKNYATTGFWWSTSAFPGPQLNASVNGAQMFCLNEWGMSVGAFAPDNSDDFIKFRRDVDTASGINIQNDHTGSSAEGYIHLWGGPRSGGSKGSGIRISANSAAGGALTDFVFHDNLAASIIQQSNVPLDFYTNNLKSFSIVNTANTVNYLAVKGGATGSSVNIASAGTDSNVNLTYDSKGTGSAHFFRVNAGGTGLFQMLTTGAGYMSGQGGTVTQATSKSTGVSLSKLCGNITMDAASLAADTAVSFAFTNANIAAGDLLIMSHISGGTLGAYSVTPSSFAAGSCQVNVRNLTAGALAEAIVLRFIIIKGQTA
jgi:hypothetical protein